MTIAEQLEQKGIEKGEREATLKIAKAMLENGVELGIVMRSTGLSEEELAKLRH